MQFIDYLYEKTSDIWDELYNHPFVLGLINGDLEESKFKYYLEEDYIYLWEHVKIYAIAITKTNDRDIIRRFTNSLYSCMNVEMEIHRQVMADFGIDYKEVEERPANLTNTSYSNYRIAQSLIGGYEEILMVLMACDLGYANIFRHIDKVNPKAKNHPVYGKFITDYLSESYMGYVDRTVDDINRIGEDLHGTKWDIMIDIFTRCLTYELKFWDMVYNEGDII